MSWSKTTFAAAVCHNKYYTLNIIISSIVFACYISNRIFHFPNLQTIFLSRSKLHLLLFVSNIPLYDKTPNSKNVASLIAQFWVHELVKLLQLCVNFCMCDVNKSMRFRSTLPLSLVLNQTTFLSSTFFFIAMVAVLSACSEWAAVVKSDSPVNSGFHWWSSLSFVCYHTEVCVHTRIILP